MWELDHQEGWVPKNWCFWTVVLDKTLESPIDSKIKLVNLKEINPQYSLEGLMLKLKLQYIGHLMGKPTHWKIPWCWERLKGRRRSRQQKMRWLDAITNSKDMNLSKHWEIVKNWSAAVHGVAKSQTEFSSWRTAAEWIWKSLGSAHAILSVDEDSVLLYSKH